MDLGDNTLLYSSTQSNNTGCAVVSLPSLVFTHNALLRINGDRILQSNFFSFFVKFEDTFRMLSGDKVYAGSDSFQTQRTCTRKQHMLTEQKTHQMEIT